MDTSFYQPSTHPFPPQQITSWPQGPTSPEGHLKFHFLIFFFNSSIFYWQKPTFIPSWRRTNTSKSLLCPQPVFCSLINVQALLMAAHPTGGTSYADWKATSTFIQPCLMKEREGNPGAFLVHQSPDAEAPPMASLPQQSADLTQGRAGGQ